MQACGLHGSALAGVRLSTLEVLYFTDLSRTREIILPTKEFFFNEPEVQRAHTFSTRRQLCRRWRCRAEVCRTYAFACGLHCPSCLYVCWLLHSMGAPIPAVFHITHPLRDL